MAPRVTTFSRPWGDTTHGDNHRAPGRPRAGLVLPLGVTVRDGSRTLASGQQCRRRSRVREDRALSPRPDSPAAGAALPPSGPAAGHPRSSGLVGLLLLAAFTAGLMTAVATVVI